ncbi:MAG: hypothetical protein ABI596_00620 [Pyrinomonadaceae bacterium]
MDSTPIAVVIGLVALFLFIFIARRMLRMAIKMVFVGVIVIALLVAAAMGWFNSSATNTERPAPARRAPAR